jgi:hypothetical protein
MSEPFNLALRLSPSGFGRIGIIPGNRGAKLGRSPASLKTAILKQLNAATLEDVVRSDRRTQPPKRFVPATFLIRALAKFGAVLFKLFCHWAETEPENAAYSTGNDGSHQDDRGNTPNRDIFRSGHVKLPLLLDIDNQPRRICERLHSGGADQ